MKKKYKNFNCDLFINSPLFDLAKAEIFRGGKIPLKKIGKKLIYDIKNPELFFIDVLDKMLELVRKANKQGQKETLDNYCKEKL